MKECTDHFTLLKGHRRITHQIAHLIVTDFLFSEQNLICLLWQSKIWVLELCSQHRSDPRSENKLVCAKASELKILFSKHCQWLTRGQWQGWWLVRRSEQNPRSPAILDPLLCQGFFVILRSRYPGELWWDLFSMEKWLWACMTVLKDWCKPCF